MTAGLSLHTRFRNLVKPVAVKLWLSFLSHYIWLKQLARAWRDDFSRGRFVDGLRLAPPRLRIRVHGDFNRDTFLQVGRRSVEDLRRALAIAGRDESSIHTVLDFGCGCARTLRWLIKEHQDWQLHGTDIDKKAIAWCRRNIPHATFRSNTEIGPLDFPPQTFDLIYSFSVFTHLDEDYQFAWLEELHRVARDGAIFVASVHGAHYESGLTPDELSRLQAEGFLYKRDMGRMRILDGLPDFYQIAYHTREYVYRNWSRYFRILGYEIQGYNRNQDMVIMQKE